MVLTESKSLTVIPPRSPPRIPFDYRPIKIRIYHNGSRDDIGTLITVTRREFKHWVIFLDAVTKKLNTTTAVHKLYTLQGMKIDHFDELEHLGEYVAVERGHFIQLDYGKKQQERREDTKWSIKLKREEERPIFLNSAEAIDIYLKHEGYGTITGLPYPLDCIMSRSPSTSALHIKSHIHKFGGSMEKLNKVGQHIWEDQEHEKKESKDSEKPCEVLHLPKLVGLSSSNTSTQREIEANKEEDKKETETIEIEDDLKKVIEIEENNIKKKEMEQQNNNDQTKVSAEDVADKMETKKEAPKEVQPVHKVVKNEFLPAIQITKEERKSVQKTEKESIKLPPIKIIGSTPLPSSRPKEVQEVKKEVPVTSTTYTRPPWRNSLPYAQTTNEIFQDMVKSGRKQKKQPNTQRDWDYEPTWQSGRNYAAALFRPREVVRTTITSSRIQQVERFIDKFDPDFN